MSAASSEKGFPARRSARPVLASVGLALLGLGAGAPVLAGDLAAKGVCASADAISFSVEHQKVIRGCTAIPLQISLWNRSEKRPTTLEKVVIQSGSRGVLKEFDAGKELPAASDDLDRFCRECTATASCSDARPCGDLHATLRSKGYDLTADVALVADEKAAAREDACVGEEIDVDAYLTVADQKVVLRKRLVVEDAAKPAPSSAGAAAGAGTETILFAGRLPQPPGWYAGDQHVHTSYEKDAGICIWEWPDSMASMIGAGISMGLNWQFFTDHSFGIDATIWSNAYNECMTYDANHPNDAYRCLYGEEVSTGNRSGQFTISHYLMLPKNGDSVGYEADGCGILCNNCKAEATVINDVSNKGGMGFINHPYDTDFSWYNWSVTGYRGMEVLNSLDGTWGTEDETSLAKWKDLLASGKNVMGLSDSDAHYVGDVGHTFTYCLLSELSTAGIRTAIASGRCVFGNGPLVDFTIGGKTLGDSLAACPGSATVAIDAYRGDGTMGYLDTIGIYVNGSLRDQVTLATDVTEYHDTRQIDLTAADLYLYVGVQNRGASKTYKAFTNPLWLSVSTKNGSDADGDTYTTCENDCDDNDGTVHPGAPELCDFKDNDCDGATDEGFDTPAGAAGLAFEANKQTMEWTAVPVADRYDVVKGDLLALLSTGGDFASSLTACLENDGPSGLATDPIDPAPDQGFYYLVRAQAACKSGTFDSGAASQTADRDAEILASPHACP